MPEPREKTWQELAAEHMVRRGDWDYEDWKARQQATHDEAMLLMGVLIGVGMSVLVWWIF